MSAAAICIIASVLTQSELTAGAVETVGKGYTFTEGPVWLGEEIGWAFSDTAQGGVHRADGGMLRGKEAISNGLTLDHEGRLIVCEPAKRRVVRVEADGSDTVLADRYNGKRFNAPNDVVARSDGRIFFTDPKSLRKDFDSPLGFSGVFSVDPANGRVSLLTAEMKYPNGILLSPDERTLYVADTSGANILAFPVAEDGSVGTSRVFCEVRIPDGMAIDRDGRLWVASSVGIAVFDAGGAPVDSFRVKPMPTNCAFGGPDGRTLFITARKTVARVLCVRPGVVAGVRDPLHLSR